MYIIKMYSTMRLELKKRIQKKTYTREPFGIEPLTSGQNTVFLDLG